MDALLRRRSMMGAGGGTSGVVFYDRLVFDGTAYIDTDIVPDTLASFRINKMGNETVKAAQRLFMNPCSNSSLSGVYLGSQTTSTTRYFYVYYGSSSYVSSNRTLAFSYTGYVLFLTPYRFGVGTNSWTITKGTETPSGPLVFGYNANRSGQKYTGTFGTVRIYGNDAQNATDASDLLDNYTPVYTLRPCTYNGEAGFWCVETSKFYGNSAGSGTLTVQNDS